MPKFFIVVLLNLSAFPAWSEEVSPPDFENRPIKYVQKKNIKYVTDETEKVENELLIGDRTSSELKFYFYIIGPNGHICSMSGEAEAINSNNYVAVDACPLQISFKGRSAYLKDADGKCKKLRCGSNAVIDGAHFLRVQK